MGEYQEEMGSHGWMRAGMGPTCNTPAMSRGDGHSSESLEMVLTPHLWIQVLFFSELVQSGNTGQLSGMESYGMGSQQLPMDHCSKHTHRFSSLLVFTSPYLHKGVKGKPAVVIRVLFVSDYTITSDGFAFDNVSITVALIGNNTSDSSSLTTSNSSPPTTSNSLSGSETAVVSSVPVATTNGGDNVVGVSSGGAVNLTVIGIAVGASVGGLLLLLVAVIIIVLLVKRRNNSNGTTDVQLQPGPHNTLKKLSNVVPYRSYAPDTNSGYTSNSDSSELGYRPLPQPPAFGDKTDYGPVPQPTPFTPGTETTHSMLQHLIGRTAPSDKKWLINYNEIRIEQQVGHGAYGVVFR